MVRYRFFNFYMHIFPLNNYEKIFRNFNPAFLFVLKKNTSPTYYNQLFTNSKCLQRIGIPTWCL